ncbi:MAG TPA: ATP-binding cassette domain-containing protein [Streptosporangiaceae bacterium]
MTAPRAGDSGDARVGGGADARAGGGRNAQAGGGWGASGLRLRYAGAVALDDVSLAVPPGEVTAVVGGDGAGKSSLLRCLAGAIRPDSGEVRGPGPLHTGYLPASSGLYPDLTVLENLQFRARAYEVSDAAAQPRIAELIEVAGLSTARDRLVGQLSGGMRQKLGVIAALVHEPELVVLDEPSTGVDPVSRSGLWSLIASAAAGGAAVVLATTYLDDAQRASWVLVLDAGRELAAGTPEEIVAAMPGTVIETVRPPRGADSARSWRRGAHWRTWYPSPVADQPAGGSGQDSDGEPVVPDLQDAVTVAALARELATASGTAVDQSWVPGRCSYSSTNQPPMKPASAPLADSASLADTASLAGTASLAETAHVTCRFGRVTAVRDVSIDVAPGEIVGLIGANGAGKTTLIRMLIGLIPATSGQVRLLGEAPSRQTRRRIGYVPQGLGLYEDLTAAENLAFASAVFGTAENPRPRPIGERGETAKRGERGIPVGELPLGLQRRTAFAQALAHDPELLILDEPTSGVDPLGRARLWQTIADAVQAGAGALVSTHYMEEAGECDRLIIMADGEVVADGTAAEIVGATQVTVVEAASWAAAFSRLEKAGLPVALAGRTLRLPGISPAAAERALISPQAAERAGATGPGDYRVYTAPATLEERFFELASTASPAQQPAGVLA